jgi:hypothetical protein
MQLSAQRPERHRTMTEAHGVPSGHRVYLRATITLCTNRLPADCHAYYAHSVPHPTPKCRRCFQGLPIDIDEKEYTLLKSSSAIKPMYGKPEKGTTHASHCWWKRSFRVFGTGFDRPSARLQTAKSVLLNRSRHILSQHPHTPLRVGTTGSPRSPKPPTQQKWPKSA